MYESCSPIRTDSLPECLDESRSTLAEQLLRTDTDVWRDCFRPNHRGLAYRSWVTIRLPCEKLNGCGHRHSVDMARCSRAEKASFPRKKCNRSTDIAIDPHTSPRRSRSSRQCRSFHPR